MQHGFLEARRTVCIYASRSCLVLFPDNVAAANRAMLRHAEWLPVLALLDHAYDPGNHIAAAFNKHFVADLDAEPRDFIFVVSRRPRDRDSSDLYWLQMRHRRQRAGPADLYADILDDGGRLPRRVFVGYCPPRRFRRPPELPLSGDRIHLHHHAVDLVRQAL